MTEPSPTGSSNPVAREVSKNAPTPATRPRAAAKDVLTRIDASAPLADTSRERPVLTAAGTGGGLPCSSLEEHGPQSAGRRGSTAVSGIRHLLRVLLERMVSVYRRAFTNLGFTAVGSRELRADGRGRVQVGGTAVVQRLAAPVPDRLPPSDQPASTEREGRFLDVAKRLLGLRKPELRRGAVRDAAAGQRAPGRLDQPPRDEIALRHLAVRGARLLAVRSSEPPLGGQARQEGPLGLSVLWQLALELAEAGAGRPRQRGRDPALRHPSARVSC